MANPLQIGLIGFSHGHQMDYGRTLAMHRDARPAAVAEVSGAPEDARGRAHDLARTWNVPFFEDYRQMLASHTLDAVSIAVPPEDNPAVVAACAACGIHVMCEKPVASTLQGLHAIKQAVRENGIVFTCAIPAVLLSSAFRPALEEIQRGAIGEVRAAHFQFLQPRGPQYALSVERCRQSRHGELANFGPYGVLALRKVFARRIVSVFTRRDSVFYPHYREHGVDDLALLSLTMEGGGVATVLVGRTTTQTQAATDCRMQVLGSEGALHIEQGLGYGFDLFHTERHARVFYGPSPSQLLADSFIAAIRTGAPLPITLDDVAEITRVIEAAYASADAEQPVPIEG